MFVQLNPETSSYSESLSTLKFAERVAGVELGAAKSNKEGRDARELMEQVLILYIIFLHHKQIGVLNFSWLNLQVAILKDTISKKDNEIERLYLLKDIQVEKRGTGSLRYEYSLLSTKKSSLLTPQQSRKPPSGKGLGLKAASFDPQSCVFVQF